MNLSHQFILSLAALFLFLSLSVHPGDAQLPAQPVNLDFEQGKVGEIPTGWFVPPVVEQAGYTAKITDKDVQSGKKAVLLSAPQKVNNGQPAFGNIMQAFEAKTYRDKSVRFRARVRIEGDTPRDKAMLWMRVDRPNQQMGFFDNMGDRPITAKEWRTYEIVGVVDRDAEYLNIGIMMLGSGKVWVDSVSFEVLGKAQREPPRPLTDRGRENIIAFTRLLGYVRYFHPSDEAAKTNWEQFAVAGIRKVEAAQSPDELAEALTGLFKPIAPTLTIYSSSRSVAPLVPPLPAGAKPTQTVAWQHNGVAVGAPNPIYSSKRVYQPAENVNDSEGIPSPEKRFTAELGGGVTCALPLTLYADSTGTLPHTAAQPKAENSSEPFSIQDRATRLADVALAWNVLQHFYPYFDVARTDWLQVLPAALTTAATDTDEAAFLKTLRRMVAGLRDGHGNVFHAASAASNRFYPPFLAAYAEDKLVVLESMGKVAGGLQRGDVIRKIDGKAAATVLAATEELISGATPQWKRSRALMEIWEGPQNSKITMEIASPNGETRTVTVKRTLSPSELYLSDIHHAGRPAKVAEVKPSILYLDIDRVDDADIRAALPKMEKAKGIIIDFRGYPSKINNIMALFTRMTDQPLTSAQWHIPLVTRPDREGMTFSLSRWTEAPPTQPRFTGKIAFLTDGGAISYAETCMGIVEHYKLGEIVGEPTAGTNGNINPFTLPGGYNIIWTGMKVLKHDGAPHHGIGIQPTIPVSRTIKGITEGRDEILEKAIAVVSP